MIRLITGGARSGKSQFAESDLYEIEKVLYIATAKVEDSEMQERVKLHKKRRPLSWGLYEGDTGLAQQITEEYDYYLLDCVTVLCSNYLFKYTENLEKITQEDISFTERKIWEELSDLLSQVQSKGKKIYIVTNEIGASPVPMHPVTRAFRDIQGRINQRLGQEADEVYLVVCSIPVKIK